MPKNRTVQISTSELRRLRLQRTVGWCMTFIVGASTFVPMDWWRL